MSHAGFTAIAARRPGLDPPRSIATRVMSWGTTGGNQIVPTALNGDSRIVHPNQRPSWSTKEG